MKALIGMYIYCVLTIPLEVRNRIVYQEMYATCKIDNVDQPTVPKNSPTLVFVDCTKAIEWLVKDQKVKPKMKFLSRYEKGACHLEKYHWEKQ